MGGIWESDSHAQFVWVGNARIYALVWLRVEKEVSVRLKVTRGSWQHGAYLFVSANELSMETEFGKDKKIAFSIDEVISPILLRPKRGKSGVVKIWNSCDDPHYGIERAWWGNHGIRVDSVEPTRMLLSFSNGHGPWPDFALFDLSHFRAELTWDAPGALALIAEPQLPLAED